MTPLAIRLPNHVGDACMTLPAIQLAVEAGLSPLLVGRAWAASLFAGLGWPVVTIEGRLLRDVRHLRRALREGAPRAARGVTFPKSFSSALLFRLAGLETAGHAVRGRGWLLDVPVAGEGEGHEVERFFGLMRSALQRWGCRVTSADPAPTLGLRLAEEHRSRARALVERELAAAPFALLAPIATGTHHGRNKQWPHFDSLSEPLRQRGLACLAAPPANEAEATRQAIPGVRLLPPVDLGTYAALAEQARVVIANDSGVSHVAAAVNARQVTVFGATDIARTRPWSPHAVLVGTPDAWPSVAEVIDAIDRALADATAVA